MKAKHKRTLCIVGISACILATPFVLSLAGLFPGSALNCWHYDVDVCSGRIRYTRYIAFVPIRQSVDESALSLALLPEDLQDSQPDWRRVTTLSPGVRNSPHFIFHSAMAQIQELEADWQTGEFTAAARRSSAKRLLELWQQGQCDDAAEPYLRTISALASRSGAEHRPTEERDLPAVP